MLFIGIVIGLLIGVLPGLTLVMGVALALPFTYKMDVTASIVLLTAMYVSGTYGGAFTAILFRIPGEPIDVPDAVGRLHHGRAAASRPRRSAGPWSRRSAAGCSRPPSWWLLTQPLAQLRAAVLVAGIFRHPAVRADRASSRSAAARSATP